MPPIDQGFLIASLLWGAVGTGYLIYGKKERSWEALLAGAAIVGLSYLVESWLWMSLACIAVLFFKHRRR